MVNGFPSRLAATQGEPFNGFEYGLRFVPDEIVKHIDYQNGRFVSKAQHIAKTRLFIDPLVLITYHVIPDSHGEPPVIGFCTIS